MSKTPSAETGEGNAPRLVSILPSDEDERRWQENVRYHPAPDELKEFYYGDRPDEYK